MVKIFFFTEDKLNTFEPYISLKNWPTNTSSFAFKCRLFILFILCLPQVTWTKTIKQNPGSKNFLLVCFFLFCFSFKINHIQPCHKVLIWSWSSSHRCHSLSQLKQSSFQGWRFTGCGWCWAVSVSEDALCVLMDKLGSNWRGRQADSPESPGKVWAELWCDRWEWKLPWV